MQAKSLMKRLLKIDKIVVEDVRFESMEEEDILVVCARAPSRESNRCPTCGHRCIRYDTPSKARRWRSLDFGSMRVYIEAYAPRIRCDEHGVLVERMPWARHGSGYTYDFETAVTWLALHATAQDVSEFFRIKWTSVGSIAKRVQLLAKRETSTCIQSLPR